MSKTDFTGRYGPWAVITGGSEGVGAAFAFRLAEQGINLILVARKLGPLEELAKEIRARYGREVITLSLDLTEPGAIEQIIVRSAPYEIGMLVHNAGADSRVATFLERPLAESEDLITLNVLTPTRLVRHFAPSMVERRRGGIVLLSSFASCVGTPGNLVYASTKAFSNIMAEGLWHELGQHGVHVLGLIIGITQTPAMQRMGLQFGGLKEPADPFEIVDEALAHIDRGPTLYAGGTYDDAMRLRSLPRAEAVREIARFSNAVVSNTDSESAPQTG